MKKVPLFLSCKLMKVIFWRLVVIIIVLGLSCCSILLFRAGRSSQQRTLPSWSSPTFINLYKYIWQFGKINVRCHFWTNFKENWSPNLQNWKKNIFIKLNFFLIAKSTFSIGSNTNQPNPVHHAEQLCTVGHRPQLYYKGAIHHPK